MREPPRTHQFATLDDFERGLVALEEMPVIGPGTALQMMDVIGAMRQWLGYHTTTCRIDHSERVVELGNRLGHLAYTLGRSYGPTLLLAQPTYICLAGPNSNGRYDTLGPLRYYVLRDEVDTPIQHVVKHVGCGGTGARRAHPNEPGCFNHGYQGSGPAELARAILRDYLALGVYQPHPSLYQAFKREHIALLPQGQGWQLEGGRIREWLWRPEVVALPWVEPPPMTDGLRAHEEARSVEQGVRAAFGAPTPADDQWDWLDRIHAQEVSPR